MVGFRAIDVWILVNTRVWLTGNWQYRRMSPHVRVPFVRVDWACFIIFPSSLCNASNMRLEQRLFALMATNQLLVYMTTVSQSMCNWSQQQSTTTRAFYFFFLLLFLQLFCVWIGCCSFWRVALVEMTEAGIIKPCWESKICFSFCRRLQMCVIHRRRVHIGWSANVYVRASSEKSGLIFDRISLAAHSIIYSYLTFNRTESASVDFGEEFRRQRRNRHTNTWTWTVITSPAF